MGGRVGLREKGPVPDEDAAPDPPDLERRAPEPKHPAPRLGEQSPPLGSLELPAGVVVEGLAPDVCEGLGLEPEDSSAASISAAPPDPTEAPALGVVEGLVAGLCEGVAPGAGGAAAGLGEGAAPDPEGCVARLGRISPLDPREGLASCSVREGLAASCFEGGDPESELDNFAGANAKLCEYTVLNCAGAACICLGKDPPSGLVVEPGPDLGEDPAEDPEGVPLDVVGEDPGPSLEGPGPVFVEDPDNDLTEDSPFDLCEAPCQELRIDPRSRIGRDGALNPSIRSTIRLDSSKLRLERVAPRPELSRLRLELSILALDAANPTPPLIRAN
jgi:hypothetical protein